MSSTDIVFVEGIWGSGKTTTIQNILNILNLHDKLHTYISDEDESLKRLYTDVDDVKRFLKHYQKRWLETIQENATHPYLFYENGLFSSLGQHWLEQEMPEDIMLNFFNDHLFSMINGKIHLIHLAPKDADTSWGSITGERGFAWTQFMELETLDDVNKNRKNKYRSIIQYIKDLDRLYRKIYSRLHMPKLKIDTCNKEWKESLQEISKFLELNSDDSSSFTNGAFTGTYRCGNKTCEVTDKGNCLHIRNIFGTKKLIMYLYSMEYPIKESRKSCFHLPSFGKLMIRFTRKSDRLSFRISDIVVQNEYFRNDFMDLDSTNWVRTSPE